MLCHCSSLARACNRPQPVPMCHDHVGSMCGVAAKSDSLSPDADLLSVCLQLFLYASNGIAFKMRTILYGRQLAVSWCTSRVNFDAG